MGHSSGSCSFQRQEGEKQPGDKAILRGSSAPHPSRQDGAKTLPGAPAVPPGNITAGWGGDMEKQLLLVLTHAPASSSASSLLDSALALRALAGPGKGLSPAG